MLIRLGTVPLDGVHRGGLAVEQLFGYMVRNAKTLGILSTMKGWCFLHRQDGSTLMMTRMFGDFPAAQNITAGAAAEGYYLTTNFTIMKALYYFSHLAETIADIPESTNGLPGVVYLPFADGTRAILAPRVEIRQQQQIAPMPANYAGGWAGNQAAVDFVQYHLAVDYKYLLFEPWKKENQLGQKNWMAKVLFDQGKVVLKLWDGWEFDTKDRDHEVEIYIHLRSLWGKYIPSLRVSTPLDYFHALILQYVNVSFSSIVLLMIRLLLYRSRI
jgi:hypothetical protein